MKLVPRVRVRIGVRVRLRVKVRVRARVRIAACVTKKVRQVDEHVGLAPARLLVLG
jgi:hypothetical protein